jgi:uncharacterized repeat protein (TIGR01451 family)
MTGSRSAIGRRTSPRSALKLFAVFAFALVVLGAKANVGLASGPVWEVSSESIPTNLAPGGTGEYILHVRNIGTSVTDGSRVTVVDKLPPGVTATSADGELFEGVPTNGEYWQCTTGTVVTCTSNPVGLATISPGPEGAETHVGTAPLIVVNVAIAGDAESGPNVVTVTGGGATEAKNSTPTAIDSSPPPFGLASIEQMSLNRDGSPDRQAGSHPYQMITNFVLNNVGRRQRGFAREVGEPEEVRDLEVGLPVGLVGSATAVPKCPRALFDRGRDSPAGFPECPPDTQVGTESATIRTPFSDFVFPVYNLEPPPGIPVQFGFAFQFRVGFIDAGVRTGDGYGVKVVVRNINQLGFLRSSLIIWGQPSDPSHDIEREGVAVPPLQTPLLTNPTSCGVPLTGLVSMDSWESPVEPLQPFSYPVRGEYPVTDNQGNPFQISGCGRLDFSPSIEAHPDTTVASTPTGLEVDLKMPQNERLEGLAEADLKDAVVTMPQGLAVSPSVANGLEACSSAQIGMGNGNAPTCPDGSKVGDVEITTPLLEAPLKGSIYVAAQGDNPFHSLLAIYVVAEVDGVLVKLAGHVVPNPVTGQLTTTFDENPQLPFSEFKLRFFNGPRAALVSPSVCGSYAASAQLTGWNGATVVPPVGGFAIESGCSHGFSPAFSTGVANNAAGRSAPFTVTVARPDGDQMLGAVSVTAPPGLLGMLSQVTLCGEPQAAQGACSNASKIGDTTAVAGPGPDPVTVAGGRVYLTGPYRGAPFGLSIVVPAVAGPFNLGTVVVRAAIYVDPHTARITVVSDPLPTIEQGIPLQIRQIEVSIDRTGFTFNPTSCAPLTVSGTIASAEGAGAAVSSPFQAADCASLPFNPGFAASTQGATSKAKGASLHVHVTSGAGQANIAKVFVSLPKQLPSRLTTLQQACPGAVFAANPAACPAASLVGTAKAVTPILNEALSGPAYLVSHGGAAFPDLVVILQGQGVVLDLVGNTNVAKGITTSTFASVPDAPVSSFELNLPEGPHSALSSNLPAKAHRDLCGTKLVMPTTITGQNGAQMTQSTKIAISGCPKAKVHTAKPRKAKRRSRARRHG